MATTPPALGYGQRGEVSIDAVNQWMRSQGWYAQLLSQWGQSPTNTHLNDDQKQQVIRAAQAHGVVVDEGGNGQEIDDSGNFRAKGHGLRNTLIVAGIAGAALLTAGAAGVGPAAGLFGGGADAATAGGAAATLGPSTAANTAATSAIVGGSAVPAGLAAPTAAGSIGAAAAGGVGAGYGPAAAGARSSITSDLLRYGLPTLGGVISGVVQANAAGKASDAQQKYLEEALAYEKEKDAGNISREAGRYADFQGNIAPYLARGNAAGDRMTALLGLPAGSAPSITAKGGSGSSGNSSAPTTPPPGTPAADWMNFVGNKDALTKWVQDSFGPNADPKTIDYYIGKVQSQPGQTTEEQNGGASFWADEFRKGGATNVALPTYGTSTSTTPSTARYGTQPVTGGDVLPPQTSASVTVRAPDGSTRTVPQQQADFYVSKGATIVGAAA